MENLSATTQSIKKTMPNPLDALTQMSRVHPFVLARTPRVDVTITRAQRSGARARNRQQPHHTTLATPIPGPNAWPVRVNIATIRFSLAFIGSLVSFEIAPEINSTS